MKKFIATAPLQEPRGEQCYRAIDNKKLEYAVPVDYPVLHIINGYLEEGDEMEAIILTIDRTEKRKEDAPEKNGKENSAILQQWNRNSLQ